MSNDDLLKLAIALLTGALAFLGTWAGSRFSRVNEHKQWLRDQKIEAYRECYKASQRWIRSTSALAKTAKVIKSIPPVGTTEELSLLTSEELAQRKKDSDERSEAIEQHQAGLDQLRSEVTDYALVPVALVASKYVLAGVKGVEYALPLPDLAAGLDEDHDAQMKLYNAAVQEMIARFKDDLGIKDSIWRFIVPAMRRRK